MISRFRLVTTCSLSLILCWMVTENRLLSDDALSNHNVKTHRLHSESQRTETVVHVLVPDHFDAEKTYPVLYILPVEPGTGTRWGSSLQESIKENLANRFEIICVFPTFSDLPWYAEHPTDSKLQQETYFIKEILPLVEKEYPVSRNSVDRYLVGFSKSGWGAWSLLLRHPELFHKAMAWDAPLMLDHPGPYGTEPIFGTEENFKEYQLTELLKSNRKTFQQQPRLYHWGYDAFRMQHEAMNKLLQQLEIKSVYRDGPQRKHHWESGWLGDAVELLLKTD
ncbi:MAG: hypothetical protein KDA65_18665 [Planctomycetaceae bacterium]|nr:hypothetical protein [Planctomycetaceae bacterium]